MRHGLLHFGLLVIYSSKFAHRFVRAAVHFGSEYFFSITGFGKSCRIPGRLQGVVWQITHQPNDRQDLCLQLAVPKCLFESLQFAHAQTAGRWGVVDSQGGAADPQRVPAVSCLGPIAFEDPCRVAFLLQSSSDAPSLIGPLRNLDMSQQALSRAQEGILRQ